MTPDGVSILRNRHSRLARLELPKRPRSMTASALRHLWRRVTRCDSCAGASFLQARRQASSPSATPSGPRCSPRSSGELLKKPRGLRPSQFFHQELEGFVVKLVKWVNLRVHDSISSMSATEASTRVPSVSASRSTPARSQVRALPTFLTPSRRVRPRPVSRPQACLPPALRQRPLGRASRRHRQRALFRYFVHWPRNSALRFTTVFNFSGSSLPT